MEFQRLKDKLGTRSLPSSEVEFRAAPARLLGAEGRGVATIIEMVTHTRLDCVIGSASLDAPRRGRGDLARPPSLRVRRAAGRPARDDQRAGGSGAGERGRDGDRAAARARLRRGRSCAAPLRHRDRQVLGLQARDAACRRGAGVPGRQRLRRGVADAAAAARRAAERDLGGLRERHRARRAARPGARARRAWRRSWPSASSPAAATRAWTRTWTRCPPTSTSGARGARSRTSRWRSRRRCSFASPRTSSPTPSAPRGWAAAGASTARCRRASTGPRSSRAR